MQQIFWSFRTCCDVWHVVYSIKKTIDHAHTKINIVRGMVKYAHIKFVHKGFCQWDLTFSSLHLTLTEFCLFVFWRYLIEEWRSFNSVFCIPLFKLAASYLQLRSFEKMNLNISFRHGNYSSEFLPQIKVFKFIFPKCAVIGKAR